MKTNLLARVRKTYNNPDVPRSTNRHNQRAWVRSVRFLGSRWLLAQPIKRASDDN